MRHPGIPVALLVSLLGCDQETVAPVAETPSFAQADINKNQVVRYQDHFATSWTDGSSSLRATHTTFPIPFMGGPEPDCGPQEDLAMIDFKEVGVVDPIDIFASELHTKATGPVWVIVRDLSQPGDCYGVKLIAEGPGELRYVDNDGFGVAPGYKAQNAWGFKGSGTLTTPDGRVLDYKGTAHYTIKADGGEPEFTRILERVSLQ